MILSQRLLHRGIDFLAGGILICSAALKVASAPRNGLIDRGGWLLLEVSRAVYWPLIVFEMLLGAAFFLGLPALHLTRLVGLAVFSLFLVAYSILVIVTGAEDRICACFGHVELGHFEHISLLMGMTLLLGVTSRESPSRESPSRGATD
ncbi:MAG: hypothetical protein IPN34_03065 [Planctomycetes bacterium]|nr:hypothetical protein [Planctomycetota bacterium]